MSWTVLRQRRLLALLGPTITALASALPLYYIPASDGVWRGRLQTDEHAILLLFLLATLLLTYARSPWSWLPWGASALLLTTNALEIDGRLPAQGGLNYPVWLLLMLGVLIALLALPRASEIAAEREGRGLR